MKLTKRYREWSRRRRDSKGKTPSDYEQSILDASITRLTKRGLIDSRIMKEVRVEWGEPYAGNKYYVAYCNPSEKTITFTSRAYRLPEWAIDTLMYHEYSHVATGQNHGGYGFRRLNARRKYQGIQEWALLVLDAIGVYTI